MKISPQGIRTLPVIVILLILFSSVHLQAADLRSHANQAGYIIITPSGYRSQAQRLAAFRHDHDGLSTMVVPLDTITAQFSSASAPDSAIRAFLSYALTDWAEPRPSTVLLMGNVNVMPTHVEPEISEFLNQGYNESLCIDQWFAEDSLDASGGARMRCALGRMPAWDSTEIAMMVDRTIEYETASPQSWWGKSVGLADYNDLEMHVFEDALRSYQKKLSAVWADTVSVTMDANSPFYRDSTAFRLLWDEGAAIMLYAGHANAYNFSAVHFFTAGSAGLLRNAPMLPLFLSIGCALRYDLPTPTIAARLMSNPAGGAIAAVVSVGVQWMSVSDAIVGGIVDRLRNSSMTTAGTAFRLAKDAARAAPGRRYTFLGDPALQLKRPTVTGAVTAILERPDNPNLTQNYPNPFNATTKIRYSVGLAGGQLTVVSHVRLAVYDLLGREVALLVDENKEPGSYEVRFDGTGLASGVYLYRMQAGEFVQTRRLILLR